KIKIQLNNWMFLFNNNLMVLVKKLVDIGHKPVVYRHMVHGLIYEAIDKDYPEWIKKYLEVGIIKADKLSKDSELLDCAILAGSKKMTKYFTDELKMKCSKTIIKNFVRKQWWRHR